MKRVVYAFSTAMAFTLVAASASLAQSVPHSDRLPPSKLQQFSRDLTPSSAQDFFKAGQTELEQEIRLLTRPRSPLSENVLTVRQGTQAQPEIKPEQPVALPRN
ncbi:MAG: hypothetical protein KME42_16250 [Tildeniella nuda ZEHNDER 1965/U140]|jgi:hypothetical protein|nr:hypothetical protein [Tildeniella nuda ZEHNDER 1965/U140]